MLTLFKSPSQYISVLVMFDEKTEPKSFRIRTAALRWTAWLFLVVFALFIFSIIYYYANASKIFYYDTLEKKYQQLAEDNKRIKLIEREYRKIKQENEKIRMVFGLMSRPDEDTVKPSLNAPADSESQNLQSRLRLSVSETENRYSMPDFFSSYRSVPSVMPVDTRMVSRRFDDTTLHARHRGVDLVAEEGAPVRATADGWVVLAEWLTDYGNTIILYHGYGYFTVYKHNQYLFMQEGQQVKGGAVIATVGNTGRSTTGTHLHFEIWKDAHPEDPADYFPQIRESLFLQIGNSKNDEKI